MNSRYVLESQGLTISTVNDSGEGNAKKCSRRPVCVRFVSGSEGSSAARRKGLQMKPEALCAQPPARAGAVLRCKLSVSLLPDMLAPKGGEILCTCILGFL